MSEVISKYADIMFKEHFQNAFYIGRFQIYNTDTSRRPHKFFYIGYRDLFGVVMPEPGRGVSYQLWGSNWVKGRSKKLDKAVQDAMVNKFPDVRHNVQLRVRAKENGWRFVKPSVRNTTSTQIALEKENSKLPIRGRKKKRRRRKLLI